MSEVKSETDHYLFGILYIIIKTFFKTVEVENKISYKYQSKIIKTYVRNYQKFQNSDKFFRFFPVLEIFQPLKQIKPDISEL